MTQNLKLFFVLFCFAFFIFLCEAQKKKPEGTEVAPKPAAPQEEQIEVDGMLLTKDGKTLIKPKSPWLHTVTIPDQVRIIRGGAFRSNHRLQSVEIPDSVEEIGLAAFQNCSKLQTVKLPEGLKKIEDYLFHSCPALTEITIPESVEEIGEGAFWHCGNLKQITIPKNVKKIGGKALTGIREVTLAEGQQNFVMDENGVLINQKEKILVRVPQSFSGTFEVPEGIKAVGNGAFYGCSSLTKVVIPDSVKTIGKDAFNKCRNLRAVVLPEGLKVIEYQSFAYCQNLAVIHFSDSVEEIKSKAFFGCINLTEIKLSKSLKVIGKDAFSSSKNLQRVLVPQEIPGKKLSEWRIPFRKIVRLKN